MAGLFMRLRILVPFRAMISSRARPAVSILMATRGDLKTLPRALAPFLQSPLEPEIVLVDDGSRDGTADYLADLPQGRLKLIRHDEPQGLTVSLNRAFQAATGAFLARQDADDVSLPERLEAQLAAFRSDPDLAILGTGHRIVDTTGQVLAELPGRNMGNPLKRLRRDNYFCHGSLMLRREALERLGGYRPFFRFAQDHDLLLRAAGLGLRLRNLRACLYDWTYSLQATSLAKAREQIRFGSVAKHASNEPDLDLAACFRALEAAEAADTAPAAVPAEWQLLKILLASGDTAGARRQYAALRRSGAIFPDPGFPIWLRLIPAWLYRPLRTLADLRYA